MLRRLLSWSVQLRSVMLACGALAGCATTPAPVVLTPEEQVRQDVNTGLSLAQEFESRIPLKQDIEVSVYLRKLAQALADASPELSHAPLGVLLIDRGVGARWQSYALPGNRVYLPVSLLRQLQFENEIAAAIALELGHLLGRDALRRLAQLREAPETTSTVSLNQTFGENGIFAFSEEERSRAAERAVDILYRAGFDPRGLVGLLARYQERPELSPVDEGTLERLQEKTRQAIATRAPLRNPVVRSPAFIRIQKRIEKL
jgi:predicted Zn-dependent protease